MTRKSVSMINALAEVDGDSGFDGFIMLGDKCVYHGTFFLPLLGLTHLDSSFHDSDGTITTSFRKRLTLKAMSKP